MNSTRLGAVALVASFLLGALPGVAEEEPSLSAAARRWVSSLSPALHRRALLAFDHPDRRNWNFVPTRRLGISLREMDETQRALAFGLFRAGLVREGVRRIGGVFTLEQELQRALGEARRRANPSWRDPLLYYVTIFGRPGGEERWGWRLEGHHLSLNFTVVGDEVRSIAPFFVGANPARVVDGPNAGLRVLGEEEDLARVFLSALNPAQRRIAIVAPRSPGDVTFGPGRSVRGLRPRGISTSALSPEQRTRLRRLVVRHLSIHRPDVAAAVVDEIDAAAMHFAWLGPLARGRNHHDVVQGPSFLLQYDQHGGHTHTLWRSPVAEFGAPAAPR
ncbi:MAG: DUF3500 domain-containing protein [Planctomycetota bacterium]|jgi:hypothetical protein